MIELMREGKCFNCKETGHKSWECPKMKRSLPAAELKVMYETAVAAENPATEPEKDLP